MATVLEPGSLRSADWELVRQQAAFDLSSDIARLNRLKAESAVLQGEGTLRVASVPDAPVLALVRANPSEAGRGDERSAACLLANRTGRSVSSPPLSELSIATGTASFRDAFTGASAKLDSFEPYTATLLLATRANRPAGGGMRPRIQEHKGGTTP